MFQLNIFRLNGQRLQVPAPAFCSILNAAIRDDDREVLKVRTELPEDSCPSFDFSLFLTQSKRVLLQVVGTYLAASSDFGTLIKSFPLLS